MSGSDGLITISREPIYGVDSCLSIKFLVKLKTLIIHLSVPPPYAKSQANRIEQKIPFWEFSDKLVQLFYTSSIFLSSAVAILLIVVKANPCLPLSSRAITDCGIFAFWASLF